MAARQRAGRGLEEGRDGAEGPGSWADGACAEGPAPGDALRVCRRALSLSAPGATGYALSWA